jgi:arylformamidase
MAMKTGAALACTFLAMATLALPFHDAHAGKGVRVIADTHYGADRAQRLDVYTTEGIHARPVIVMVHGGGWMFGDKANPGVAGAKLEHFAAEGYVFVSVDYRLWPGVGPVEQAGDVALALAYVQKHAQAWGGDGSRVILMGHSAGAHLVALLAATPELARLHGAAPWLGTVVLDSAALDVPKIMRGPHAGFYDQVFGRTSEGWRDASPVDRLAGKAAPMLLVCSDLRLLSCPNAREFIQRARSFGAKASVLPVALSHGQINATLGEPGDYTRAVDAFLASLSAHP